MLGTSLQQAVATEMTNISEAAAKEAQRRLHTGWAIAVAKDICGSYKDELVLIATQEAVRTTIDHLQELGFIDDDTGDKDGPAASRQERSRARPAESRQERSRSRPAESRQERARGRSRTRSPLSRHPSERRSRRGRRTV